MSQQDFLRRRKRLAAAFRREKIDGLLVSDSRNIFYLTGFRGEDSALLLTRQGATLVTDKRYDEQAAHETRGVAIHVRKKGLLPTCGQLARKAGIETLGVEAAVVTLLQADDLRAALGKTRMQSVRGMVQRLRLVKDAGEIALIRRAAQIAQEAFLHILPQIRLGRTEIELARMLDAAMQEMGADGPAFDTIVAVAERGSLPHARPTARRVRRGEPILFDWGARFQMYHSDLTRVLFVDRIPPLCRKVHACVLAAQRRAVARVKHGRRTGDVDAAARNFLKSRRYGRHFGHGTGHGVGLQIHEGPTLGQGQTERLRAGMVVTVEPGVYLPGRCGIRIEDLLLVTRNGHESLTTLPRSPEELLLRT